MTLHVQLLGELRVTRGSDVVALPTSRKTRALLAFLALTGRPHRRERLCDLFWELPDDPRGALRWSLSKLRAVLNNLARPRVDADRERVALVLDCDEVDLRAIRAALAVVLADCCAVFRLVCAAARLACAVASASLVRSSSAWARSSPAESVTM